MRKAWFGHANSPTGNTRTMMLVSGALSFAVLLGMFVAGVAFPQGLALPPAALIGVMLPLLLLPLLLGRWRISVGVFLVWLVVEDLIRKLAGNDIRVYFVKDLIFLVVMAAVAISPEARGAWRRATGRDRFLLYALLAWAVAMSISTGFQDWRVPLVGLRLDFMYLPLVVPGYLLSRNADSFKRSLGWMALLGGIASAIGVAQGILGPQFLNPGLPTPGLKNLILVRGTGLSGDVYRPTGTFVDPGRFTSLALVAMALALAVLATGKLKPLWRSLVALAALVAVSAAWVSGGRAGVVIGAALVASAFVAGPFAERRPKLGRSVSVAVAALGVFSLLAAISPYVFQSRLIWYQQTLDPRSQSNEWAYRFDNYWSDTVRGVRLGGLFGQGTGKESLGKQYFLGGSERSIGGLYQVEGGYASVATEWGVVGLILWLGWTIAWTRRQWGCIRRVRGSPLAAGGMVLFVWMVFFLFIGFFSGLQTYQNYLPNAYFWLLSGVIFSLPGLANAPTDLKVQLESP